MSRGRTCVAALLSCAATVSCSDVLGIRDLPPIVEAPDTADDGGFDVDSEVVDSTSDTCGDACACPAPTPGDVHVAPTGFDDGPRGNGSSACPWKTITRALASLEGTTTAATITLHHVGALATFGDGCTYGKPCDPMPIVVPATIMGGLEVRGDGAIGDVLVSGASVFSVHAPGVSFSQMTITPTEPPGDGTAGYGIQYESDVEPPPTGVPSPTLHDLAIVGSLPAGAGQGTGNALAIRGKPALHIGPAVTFDRGLRAIFHGGRGELAITGTDASPIAIGGGGRDCVLVSGAGDDPPSITMDYVTFGACGINALGHAALWIDTSTPSSSRLTHFRATERGTTKAVFAGVVLAGRASLVLEDGTFDTADPSLVVGGSASLVARRLDVKSEKTGVALSTSGDVTLEALTLVSGGDGVACTQANLTMRGCTLVGNAGNGASIASGCVVDLGTAASPGGNVFDRTSTPNGKSGLCFLSPRTLTIVGATFGCGYAGTGCIDGTPTPIVRDGACATGDVTIGTGGALTIVDGKCCD